MLCTLYINRRYIVCFTVFDDDDDDDDDYL